jgi:hypothetical protein
MMSSTGAGDRHSADNGFTFIHEAPKNLDSNPASEPFPWEMIGLGLEEPLPTQDVINDLYVAQPSSISCCIFQFLETKRRLLRWNDISVRISEYWIALTDDRHQIYFDKIHMSMPMIHRPRYLAAMNLAPNMRPPVCLRYSIWCMAASVSDKYGALTDHFYRRARKYAEIDEMRGHGESIITVAHCQTWVLLSLYEFKKMCFPRAWQGTHRAVSLALMMGLYSIILI